MSLYLTVLETESSSLRLWIGPLTAPHLGRYMMMRACAGSGNPPVRQEDKVIQDSGYLSIAISLTRTNSGSQENHLNPS